MSHPTAYIFPGQGSQAVGMGQALSEAYPVVRETFAAADAILGFSLTDLCFNGPPEQLTDTVNAQPAILSASIGAWRALHQACPDLPQPCCLAGHSLGEYSALVAAGLVLSGLCVNSLWPRFAAIRAARHPPSS